MLPVYKAQSFNRILDGGSTYPWLILVKVDGIDTPYVVKIYPKDHVEKTHCVAKDVYCSILAKEFDLDTPKPALIEFPDYFTDSLDDSIRDRLIGKDTRIKFGCAFIEGAYQYDDTLHRSNLEKYSIETIYAFDNLVYNVDRKNEKSNILLKGTKAYLIDHELTLSVNIKTISDFQNNIWNYNNKKHIFYPFLKHSRKEDKQTFFEDFKYYLGIVNFNILDSYSKQLISYNHHTKDDYLILNEYLCNMKLNTAKFVKLLIGHLQ